MVAFINNQMPVGLDAIVNSAFADQALNEGNIQYPRESILPAAQTTDCFCRYIQKRRQTLDPLFEKLLAVNQNQSVYTTVAK